MQNLETMTYSERHIMELQEYCKTPSQKQTAYNVIERLHETTTHGKKDNSFNTLRKSITTLPNGKVVFSYTLENKYGFLYGFHGSIGKHGKLSIEETY